ncbi:Acetolactate synthase small subunit [Blattabacterium sp. (Nauphoeta cinerea)]|uniref:acetolactate synthase small subunit n=1 Tax=Blattabacterium sp. (Nauphoeta cinerea) TaxID=1316444 RepID=UPI0003B0DE8E|nr:acetolactate synthase small subunit [Blattabacterium sp. (Nauphoeta cinerea)]AGW86301.1 Acetolactate synthase small subunit [Blattabacterium sp. (Nauphoeta cinerea)]
MKHQFRIIILGEKETRLLSRILIILNRINLKTNHINASSNNDKKTISNDVQYVVDLECEEEQLFKIKKLIEKLIGIIHVYYYKLKDKNSRKNSCKKMDFPLVTY